MIQDQL